MKKHLTLLIAVVLILIGCSCRENEGDLLSDLGAKSFDSIEKVEFLYEEYQRGPEEKLVINQTKDIELLCDYVYDSDWPDDQLHELFVYPNNSIYITVGGIQYSLHLADDGSLTTVPNSNNTKAKTYRAKEGKGINEDVWRELVAKYQ